MYITKNYKVLATVTNESGVDRFIQTINKDYGSFQILTDATNCYADWLVIGY